MWGFIVYARSHITFGEVNLKQAKQHRKRAEKQKSRSKSEANLNRCNEFRLILGANGLENTRSMSIENEDLLQRNA